MKTPLDRTMDARAVAIAAGVTTRDAVSLVRALGFKAAGANAALPAMYAELVTEELATRMGRGVESTT